MRAPLNVPYPVLKLPANTVGRDFIIGDLHGCVDLLEERLQAVRFDPSCDRLLSVGDLVDRGPFSFEALCLLEKPWFKAVIGNHEAMLLTYLMLRASIYHSPRDFLYNGGDWVLELTMEQREHLEQVLAPLLLKSPLVIQVEDADCPYNILHAEAESYGQNAGLLKDEDLQNVEKLNEMEVLLTWSRRLVASAKRGVRGKQLSAERVALAEPALEPGLSLTYVGHSINEGLILHRSHLFMDCGAFKKHYGESGTLALLNHREVVQHLRKQGVAL